MSGRNHMPESIEPRVKIKGPWVVEVELIDKDGHHHGYLQEGILLVNLVSNETGEIRQKRVSLDTLGRRVFASELKTWRKRYGGSWAVETEARIEREGEGS